MNKKILSLLCLFLIQGQLFAQFNAGDFGKYFDCTIILKSGESKNVSAQYEHPDILKNPTSPLNTREEHSSVVLSIDKRLIETFYMNNQCWAERSTPLGRQWAILDRQGAIEHIIYITSDSKGGPGVVTGDFISKNGQTETNTSMIMGYKKKMSSFVSDYPELATKVTNGEKGYGFITYLNVVDEYNAWFDKNNPDKIKYYPWFSKGKKTAPGSLSDVAKVLKESKDSVANARKEFVASRPTAVAPEIASKKQNIPVKKEAFTAKVKRYEADGHKIAVVMQEQKTKIRATIRAQVGNPKDVGFKGDPETDFNEEGVLEKTVTDLNRIYKTTIFEAVSVSQIPLVEVKSFQVDDWWSTCYKTVVHLSNIREFSCSNDMMTDGAFEGTASIGLYANVFEYIDDGKHGTNILKRLYVLGYGNSDSFKYTQSDWPISFAWMEAKVDWLKVRQRYDKKRQDQFAKLVEKWD